MLVAGVVVLGVPSKSYAVLDGRPGKRSPDVVLVLSGMLVPGVPACDSLDIGVLDGDAVTLLICIVSGTLVSGVLATGEPVMGVCDALRSFFSLARPCAVLGRGLARVTLDGVVKSANK